MALLLGVSLIFFVVESNLITRVAPIPKLYLNINRLLDISPIQPKISHINTSTIAQRHIYVRLTVGTSN